MGVKTEVKTVTRDTVFVTAGICDNCFIEIPSAWGPVISGSSVNFPDMLPITLHGGYANYFDGPETNLLLCKTCADKLCELFPSVKKAINLWDD